MTGRRALLTLLVAGILSGCAAPPEGPLPTTGTEVEMITRAPGVTFPPIPASPALRFAKLENCSGLATTIEVPEPWVQAATPSQFEVSSLVPGTDIIGVFLLECPRLALPGRVLNDVALLVIGPSVRPVDRSWETVPAPGFYLYDLVASDLALVEQLRTWGLEAEFGKFSRSPSVQPGTDSWAITLEDASFAIDHQRGEDESNRSNATNYWWTGEETFLRSSLAVDYGYRSGALAGSIAAMGESRTAQVLKSGRSALHGNAISTASFGVTVEPQVYGS